MGFGVLYFKWIKIFDINYGFYWFIVYFLKIWIIMKLKNIIVVLLIGVSLYFCDYLDIVFDDIFILVDVFKNE